MPNQKIKKKVSAHRSENDERALWSQNDSTDYVDWSHARPVAFPNLRPTLQTGSIRLPVHMLEEIKTLARKQDIAYQALMKMMLAESLKRELSSK